MEAHLHRKHIEFPCVGRCAHDLDQIASGQHRADHDGGRILRRGAELFQVQRQIEVIGGAAAQHTTGRIDDRQASDLGVAAHGANDMGVKAPARPGRKQIMVGMRQCQQHGLDDTDMGRSLALQRLDQLLQLGALAGLDFSLLELDEGQRQQHNERAQCGAHRIKVAAFQPDTHGAAGFNLGFSHRVLNS